MPPPLSPHGTVNRWRSGCRDCDPCYQAHLEDLKKWRRERADRLFPARKRARALDLISHGATPADAARALGIPVQRIHSRSRIDPTWQRKLDKALMKGRHPGVPHGSPGGYRIHRCHCPECRAAHHPRGAADA